MCFRSIFSVSNVSKVNSWRFGWLSWNQLNRKASSTVILSEEAVETNGNGLQTQKIAFVQFLCFMFKSVYFQKHCLSFPFWGIKFPTCAWVSLCLNGLRIKLSNALLLQSIHLPLQWNSWRDQGVSFRTDDTKGPSQFVREPWMTKQHHTCLTRLLPLLFLSLQMPIGKKTVL